MNQTARRNHREDRFRFGLEAEYLLVDAATFRPLSFREMSFRALNEVLESISVGDLPPPHGLELIRPHGRLMHYYVEGYHVPDVDAAEPDLIPKGIEIRTPPRSSIAETLSLFATLHERLQRALADRGWQAVALSHHPLDDHFEGPRGSRTIERWNWSMQAMLTYGPDVNISLPARLSERIIETDLIAKVNHYAPALAVMSLASPFHRGQPWMTAGRIGKSLRTHRRSVFGQPLRLHPAQGGRTEFKGFEMSHRVADFEAYFLLWLTLLLDQGLKGRSTLQSRVYDLGAVARDGLAVNHVRERAAEVLERANRVLPMWGFETAALKAFAQRLASRLVPADEIIAWYREDPSLPNVLRRLAVLHTQTPRTAIETAA